MKNVITFIFVIVFLVVLGGCRKNDSSETGKILVVGYKAHPVLNAVEEGFIEELENLGYPKSRIQTLNPDGDLSLISAKARATNSNNTSLVVTISTPTSQTFIPLANSSVPILYSFVSVPEKLKKNNTLPENVTGISNQLDYEKGFDLLESLIPSLSKIGIIYNPTESNSSDSAMKIQAEAEKRGLEFLKVPYSDQSEIKPKVAAMAYVDVIYVGGDNDLVKNMILLVDAAETKNIPVFASDEGSVKSGAIAAYSIDYLEFGRETARLADQLLKDPKSKMSPVEYTMGRAVFNTEQLKVFGLKKPTVK